MEEARIARRRLIVDILEMLTILSIPVEGKCQSASGLRWIRLADLQQSE
jgi:hypothetical protein